MKALALVLALASVAIGCVQRAAPVVDLPVRSGVDETTAVAAAKPAATTKPAQPSTPSNQSVPAGQSAPAGQSTAAGQNKPAAPSPPADQTKLADQSKPTGSGKPPQAPQASASEPAPPASPATAAKPSAPLEGGEGEWPPEFYTVKKGDTLYSIALDHGQGYRDVAAWNNLTDPNVIKIDQQLRVRPPPGWKDSAEEEGVIARGLEPPPAIEPKTLEPPPVKRAPKAVKMPYSDQALAQLRGVRYKPSAELAPRAPRADPATQTAAQRAGQGSPSAPIAAQGDAAKPGPGAQAPARAASAPTAAGAPTASGAITWSWPTRGPLLHGFDQGANPKGIAVGGEPGQPILAGAPGKVVYSGSGLRGYGKLIIIKHDPTYLSVYAHNRELLVKEGERVAKGQKIAEMGDGDGQRPELHFEIRKLGKPVDPLQYLPPQGG